MPRNGRQRGSDGGYTYFLTEGEVELEAADGITTQLTADRDSIRTPIAILRPRILSVRALGRVRGIRLPDIVLSAAGCNGRGLR